MNSTERRSVMFGKKAVIEMDIDPSVSNMDTPDDLKFPVKVDSPKLSIPRSPEKRKITNHQQDDKKENDASKADEPEVKKKC